jgi:hypothetical protein
MAVYGWFHDPADGKPDFDGQSRQESTYADKHAVGYGFEQYKGPPEFTVRFDLKGDFRTAE